MRQGDASAELESEFRRRFFQSEQAGESEGVWPNARVSADSVVDWSGPGNPIEDIRRAIREREVGPKPVVQFEITQGEYEFLREYARMGAFLRAHGVRTDD